MTAPVHPTLEPGRVYRTREFRAWSANAPRLAKRLMREGRLRQLASGLYAHESVSRFGAVPPTDHEIMRGFLEGGPFVFTGPDRWNVLELGTTTVFAVPLVYNTKRSGTFELGGRPFRLRRVAFPANPSLEWFVVDLIEHADEAGASRTGLQSALGRALARNRFDRDRLREMAQRYGTRVTRVLVDSALRESSV